MGHRFILLGHWMDALFRKGEWVVFVICLVLLVFLHVVYMTHAGGLWRDEIHSLNLATLPSIAEIWRFLALDSFPLFWFLVLRAWSGLAFGSLDHWLRIFGLIIGLLNVGALLYNARNFGFNFPVVSIAVFAFNPMLIRYGDSVRAYGLGTLFLLLTFGCVWKVIEAPTLRRSAAAAVGAFMSAHTLFFNPLLLFGICMGGITVSLRRRMWKSAILLCSGGVAVALTLLPYTRAYKARMDIGILGLKPITLEWIWGRFSQLLASPGEFFVFLWVILFALGIGTAAYCSVRRSAGLDEGAVAKDRDLTMFAAISLIVGLVGYAGFLMKIGLPTQPWNYLPFLAFAAASLDVMLTVLTRNQAGRFFRLALALITVTAGYGPARNEVHVRQTNIDSIASYLEGAARKGDMILVSPWYCGITFQRYYHGEVSWTTLPPLESYHLQRFDLLRENLKSVNPIQPVLDEIAMTLQSGKRVWTVGLLPVLGKNELPPDLSPAGASASQYLEVWLMKTGYFVQRHALHTQHLPSLSGVAAHPYEQLRLAVITGWKP